MKNIILMFLLFVGIGRCVHNGPAPEAKARGAASVSVGAGALVERGPLQDCKLTDFLKRDFGDLDFICNENYVHILAKNQPAPAANDLTPLQIGSFNLLHLGDSQAPMKNFALVAMIMNQWDLVGAQELMPINSAEARYNQVSNDIIKNDNVELPAKSTVNYPGYLNLLKELRALDPTWALIIQPRAQGEGSTGEMAGFYYRGKKLQPMEWKYCADLPAGLNLACVARVPDAQRKLMSRNAFVARFKTAKWDFITITTHVRFREADDPKDLKAQGDELCAGVQACDWNNENVGRFYEVKAVMDQAKALKKFSADIIFMGDFNLEVTSNTQELWDAALRGSDGMTVHQTEMTTLGGAKNELVSNYDHFIFNEQVTKNCDPQSIKTFDFTRARINSAGPGLIGTIQQNLTDAGRSNLLNQHTQFVNALVRPVTRTTQGTGAQKFRPVNSKEAEAILAGCRTAYAKMSGKDMTALMELISDHIPIHMSCAVH